MKQEKSKWMILKEKKNLCSKNFNILRYFENVQVFRGYPKYQKFHIFLFIASKYSLHFFAFLAEGGFLPHPPPPPNRRYISCSLHQCE